MTKINYKKTSELRALEGAMVDYIADGIITRDGEDIPCEIGYTEWMDEEDIIHIDPDYLFIKEGITPAGTHYNAETILI